MRIGLIGLGNMGSRMATHLLTGGSRLVVFNRTRARTARLEAAGAGVADTPAALTRSVDIVLCCVSDGAASRDVFLGPDGALETSRRGQIFVDHSTVEPECTRRIREAASERGVRFLDAPISGGPEGARDGSLTVMVGGDREEFLDALPVLRRIGGLVVHMGPSGSGTLAKLVNQMLVGIHSQAACEALLVGIRSGLDPERLLGVIMNSWGASRMVERNGPLISGDLSGSSSSAPLRNLLKDLEIGARAAEAAGVSVPLTRQALDSHRTANDLGLGDRDLTAVCESLLKTCASPGP